jgi:hypothetical protein
MRLVVVCLVAVRPVVMRPPAGAAQSHRFEG